MLAALPLLGETMAALFPYFVAYFALTFVVFGGLALYGLVDGESHE